MVYKFLFYQDTNVAFNCIEFFSNLKYTTTKTFTGRPVIVTACIEGKRYITNNTVRKCAISLTVFK